MVPRGGADGEWPMSSAKPSRCGGVPLQPRHWRALFDHTPPAGGLPRTGRNGRSRSHAASLISPRPVLTPMAQEREPSSGQRDTCVVVAFWPGEEHPSAGPLDFRYDDSDLFPNLEVFYRTRRRPAVDLSEGDQPVDPVPEVDEDTDGKHLLDRPPDFPRFRDSRKAHSSALSDCQSIPAALAHDVSCQQCPQVEATVRSPASTGPKTAKSSPARWRAARRVTTPPS